jgi:hypothetical protein
VPHAISPLLRKAHFCRAGASQRPSAPRHDQSAGAGVPLAQAAPRGVYATLDGLAKAKGVAASYVSRVLRLTLLGPDTVEAILDGRPMQLNDLLKGFPSEWQEQKRTLST